MEVWREAAQLCPPSPLPSRARIEVPQCRPPVPEIHTSPGVPRCFFFSPQREGGDPRCNVHGVQAAEEARALQNPTPILLLRCVYPVFLFFFCPRLSRLLQAPTLPGSLPPSLAADESCTCCIRTERGRESEQAQDLSPAPLPPPSISPSPPSLHAVRSVLFPRWLSFTVSLPDKPGEARRAGPRQGFSLWLQQQPPHPVPCLAPAMLCMRQVLNGEEGCVCVGRGLFC